jgi:propanol-preferring alcohol dehydrogenase
MPSYRAYEVSGARRFTRVIRETVPPPAGHVRIDVETCGVCHSDAVTVEGHRADPDRPVVPGHEIVGVIAEVGAGVTAWRVGERVGVGYLGGHCGQCERCRRGDFVNCTDQPRTGHTTDGGYAESVTARASGLVRIPDGLTPVEASPLLCAGLTTYKALLQTGARPGALVGVQGIGGLGHLAVQYATRLGYRVAAIARGTAKAELASRLGADVYIDGAAEDPGAALRALGGAEAIIATGGSGAAMGPLVPGLAPRGRLIVVGIGFDPIAVSTVDLIFGTRTITGSLTGTPIENEDNLAFGLHRGIRSMNEVMPLSEAPAAYERMISGEARFRVVLDATA